MLMENSPVMTMMKRIVSLMSLLMYYPSIVVTGSHENAAPIPSFLLFSSYFPSFLLTTTTSTTLPPPSKRLLPLLETVMCLGYNVGHFNQFIFFILAFFSYSIFFTLIFFLRMLVNLRLFLFG